MTFRVGNPKTKLGEVIEILAKLTVALYRVRDVVRTSSDNEFRNLGNEMTL